MPYTRGRGYRAGRWMLILAACALCVLLLFLNALHFFPHEKKLSFLNLARFGFSAFTALTYLSVGSLVWLFARQRRVAHFLFVFSLAMVVTFANETARSVHNPLFASLPGISGVIAIAAFAILLLLFPYNYLESFFKERSRGSRGVQRISYGHLCIRLYIGAHLLCAGLVIVYALANNLLALHSPAWLNLAVNLYYLAALACILLTITGAYCFSQDLRIRQQLLLFVIGVLLSFAPGLFLTILPLALNLPARYIVDGQWSSLPLILLPLALGYSVLRYQILVFDSYIRRVVSWMVGSVCLALLCYLEVALSGLAFAGPDLGLEHIICVAAGMMVLGPLTWWLARVATERLFFPEIRYYRQHMQRPESLAHGTFDLKRVSELLLLAAMQAFETREVCLYVLDERTGSYHLAPALEAYRYQGVICGQLQEQLAGFSQLIGESNSEVMDTQHRVIQRISLASRPLFLYEALDDEQRSRGPAGLARYLVTTQRKQMGPLLVPIRVQDRMIGLLCLGERGGGQPYAGPDFEVIHLLLSHFSSMLETARLYVQASRHMAVLNAFYSASARLERSYMSIEEVAVAYATVAAEAMQGVAEIWLYAPERTALHRVVHAGQGPSLFQSACIQQLQEQDWSAWFQEGHTHTVPSIKQGKLPVCLEHLSRVPLAWLPLCKGQRRMGMLMLSFPGAHVFSVEEKRILGMFARQCAAAMENAQITIALRAAYERQKELDYLKDQFIMTASHELRTPLTAVQGYIELLREYNDELSSETRTEFIQKAHRGCDELALMVGNIMDASRVQIESERIRLVPVDLASSVQQVIEIMDSVITREQRTVELALLPALFIQADDLRLRQILLNLVSNALKYSPAGTPIRLHAQESQGMVKISVRDYGLGVPPEEQGRLFERFMRLERDINSPVRGVGLGLSITKRLVDAMGGRLWVESSGIVGEGSTFSFTLQRAVLPQYSVDSSSPLLARQSG